MMRQEVDRIFLCPACMTPAETAGECPECGTVVIECRPGDADDPCRRPLMDEQGRVLTRAPVWWLQHRVGRLIDALGLSKESE